MPIAEFEGLDDDGEDEEFEAFDDEEEFESFDDEPDDRVAFNPFSMDPDPATYRINDVRLINEIEEMWGYRYGDISLDIRRMSHELRAARGWPEKVWVPHEIYYHSHQVKKDAAAFTKAQREKNRRR